MRQIFRGLPSCNSAGSKVAGMFWKQTARAQRVIEDVPTEVARPSEVAGNGPPWTVA